ncbi:MAG: hypothetical protein KIY11_01850 [Thermoplasmata archaeon]|nr:hypothetical protein [Candidatus Sysuiplasma acidicola]
MIGSQSTALFLLLGVLIPGALFTVFVIYNVNIFFIILLMTYALTFILVFYRKDTQGR